MCPKFIPMKDVFHILSDSPAALFISYLKHYPATSNFNKFPGVFPGGWLQIPSTLIPPACYFQNHYLKHSHSLSFFSSKLLKGISLDGTNFLFWHLQVPWWYGINVLFQNHAVISLDSGGNALHQNPNSDVYKIGKLFPLDSIFMSPSTNVESLAPVWWYQEVKLLGGN